MQSKVIVITGASAGIGAETAKLLGAEGHKIVLAARREIELKDVAAKSGEDALTVACDVTKRDEVDALKDAALNHFGHVDVWINNAGRGIEKRVLELSDDDVDQIIAVNVKSVLYGIQAIIPHFKERSQGHLINISSFLGKVPYVSFRSVYSAAKAAVNSLTTNLRMDLKDTYPNINVSLVMPGRVLTAFHKNSLGSGHEAMLPASGMAKPQTAAEVAAVIVATIKNPQPEVFTNPAMLEILARTK